MEQLDCHAFDLLSEEQPLQRLRPAIGPDPLQTSRDLDRFRFFVLLLKDKHDARGAGGKKMRASLGHTPTLFATPALAEHVLGGILFALGDLEADATPSAKRRQ